MAQLQAAEHKGLAALYRFPSIELDRLLGLSYEPRRLGRGEVWFERIAAAGSAHYAVLEAKPGDVWIVEQTAPPRGRFRVSVHQGEYGGEPYCYAKAQPWESEVAFEAKARAEEQALEALRTKHQEERAERQQKAMAGLGEPLPVLWAGGHDGYRREMSLQALGTSEELADDAQRAAELSLAGRGESGVALRWGRGADRSGSGGLIEGRIDGPEVIQALSLLLRATPEAAAMAVCQAAERLGMGPAAALSVCGGVEAAAHSSTDWWVDHQFIAVTCRVYHTRFVVGDNLAGLPTGFQELVCAWVCATHGVLPAALRDAVVTASWERSSYERGCRVLLFSHIMNKDMS